MGPNQSQQFPGAAANVEVISGGVPGKSGPDCAKHRLMNRRRAQFGNLTRSPFLPPKDLSVKLF
jgi:hypothetical protein